MRNITSIKANRLFTRDTRGMIFTVSRDIAVVVAQELYGTHEVPNNIDRISLQQKLDQAYDSKIFSWRIKVK